MIIDTVAFKEKAVDSSKQQTKADDERWARWKSSMDSMWKDNSKPLLTYCGIKRG